MRIGTAVFRWPRSAFKGRNRYRLRARSRRISGPDPKLSFKRSDQSHGSVDAGIICIRAKSCLITAMFTPNRKIYFNP